MNASTLAAAQRFPHVTVLSTGRVSDAAADRLAAAVSDVLRRQSVTGGVRVRLGPVDCADGSALVQMNLRVAETAARSQAVISGWDDPSPALSRLDRQIVRTFGTWRPRPWPDETRTMLVAATDAVVSRRESCVLQRMTSVQALAVMDAMDYDVHLFADTETGEDAVVYRAGPWGMRVARRCCMRPPAGLASVSARPIALVVNPRRAPVLTEAAAVKRVCAAQLGFLFFCDPSSGRGRLLYPRYDGNLGLITPACDDSRDDAA